MSPVKSKAQLKWIAANHPSWLREWTSGVNMKRLPGHVRKRRNKKPLAKSKKKKPT